MRTCSVDGCERVHFGRSWCRMHYERVQRGGPPGEAAQRQSKTVLTAEERYWPKVDRRGDDECWPWTAATDDGGYGAFWNGTHLPSGGPHMVSAHRWAAMNLHGFAGIPSEVHICHTCDNRRCQNPGHWFLGSAQDNHDDKMQKGRGPRREKNPRAILTEQDVIAIRAQRGIVTQRALAAQYGVSAGTISAVQTGRNWPA